MANELSDIPGYETYLKKCSSWSFKLEEVTDICVMKIMKEQQPKLSCRINTINNKIVKTCHQELAKLLTMVNQSIRESKVPLYKKAITGQ